MTGRGAKARVIVPSDEAMALMKASRPPVASTARGCLACSASVSISSARSSPTPSTSRAAAASARDASARLTYSLVAIGVDAAAGASGRGRAAGARISATTAPLVPSTVTTWPSWSTVVGGASADDAGHAQLTADDGGVARHPAALGHHGGGAPQRGQPVGVRHGRHQHLAVEQGRSRVRRAQHPDGSGRHTRRGAETLHEHGAHRRP